VDGTESGQYVMKKKLENSIDMGKAFFRTNMLDKAAACFEEALENQESPHEALFYLGVISFRKGEYQKAVEMFKKLLEIRTDSIHTYNNLALSLEKCNRMKEAMLVYNTGLEITPASSLLLANRGVLKYKSHDFEGAVQDLSRAVKKRPGILFLYFYLANACAKTDRLAEARDYLEEALSLLPDNVTVLNNLGYLSMELGFYDEARDYLKRAVRNAGGLSSPYVNLARLYAHSGRLEMSVLMISKAFPGDQSKISLHLHKLSNLLSGSGKEEEARYLERQAKDVASGNSKFKRKTQK